MNSAACKLLGYSNGEILNKPGLAVFDTTEASFKKMLRRGKKEGVLQHK